MGESPSPTPAGDATAELRLLEEAARLGEAWRELQESASLLMSRTWNEEQGLRQQAAALESDLKKLKASINSAIRKGAIDAINAEKLDEELYRARCLITEGDVASLLPNKDHGKFLNMFLGPVNVRMSRKEVRLKVKEEYNNYRKGVELFLFWAVMQGFAMLLQNSNQRQRLYTRIVLGKVVVCGVLLVLVAIGNFANTLQTLMAKSRFRAKMKRSKSKHDFDQSPSPPAIR